MLRFALALLAAAVLLAGCVRDTLNVGEPYWQGDGPVPVATTDAPNGWFAGETGVLKVTWTGGWSPYTIACNMGGGIIEDVPSGTPAESPFTHEFTLEEGTWTYTVTVIDSGGIPGTCTGTFDVGPPLNQPPSIDNVTLDSGLLTVEVSDPDGDPVTVELALPAGLDAHALSEQAVGGVATFEIFATDIIAGGTGTFTITATDGQGGEDQDTLTVTIDPIVVAEGALVAIPSMGATTVGGEVTVVVISGDFPAGAPFHYMNGVAVTVEEGATYVDGTYNVGAVGGDQKDPDGLWAEMSPPPSSFLLPDDFMIMEQSMFEPPGLHFIGFNLTPIGGSEVTTGGILFNFGLTFDHAGTYNLGFLEFQDVKRTYYSDSEAAEYYWDDISNSGVPNTIDVT